MTTEPPKKWGGRLASCAIGCGLFLLILILVLFLFLSMGLQPGTADRYGGDYRS